MDAAQGPGPMAPDQALRVMKCGRQRGDGLREAAVAQRDGHVAQKSGIAAAPDGTESKTFGEFPAADPHQRHQNRGVVSG